MQQTSNPGTGNQGTWITPVLTQAWPSELRCHPAVHPARSGGDLQGSGLKVGATPTSVFDHPQVVLGDQVRRQDVPRLCLFFEQHRLAVGDAARQQQEEPNVVRSQRTK